MRKPAGGNDGKSTDTFNTVDASCANVAALTDNGSDDNNTRVDEVEAVRVSVDEPAKVCA